MKQIEIAERQVWVHQTTTFTLIAFRISDWNVELSPWRASAVFGREVTAIGEYSFEGCHALKSVIIPNSVTRLDIYSFSGCILLSDITIGNQVQTIGKSAFSNCKSLASIIIPKSVKNINNNS